MATDAVHPVRGAPTDPIAVVADQAKLDYFAPAVANPQQLDHYFRVPASDPGRPRPTRPGGDK